MYLLHFVVSIDSSLELRSTLDITGKGLELAYRNELEIPESGLLDVNCTIRELFNPDRFYQIHQSGYLPIHIELQETSKEDVQILCDVKSTGKEKKLLSKPLSLVLSPQVMEVEVVVFHSCSNKHFNNRLGTNNHLYMLHIASFPHSQQPFEWHFSLIVDSGKFDLQQTIFSCYKSFLSHITVPREDNDCLLESSCHNC